MKRTFLLIASIVFVSAGCNTPDSNLVNCEFDQQAMLTNVSENIIQPRFENFSLSLQLLESSINAFNSNPTAGLLGEVRVYYRASYLAYQECSPFAFGPGLVNGLPFRERFNTFPTNVSTIEDNIATGTSVSVSGKSVVGFPALEYLIYGDQNLSEQDLLNQFVTSAEADNRKTYLLELASEMKETTAQIVQDWETYASVFENNLGTAEGSSIALVVNEFNFDFETIKNFKFKIPLGKFNGGVVIPESVEGYYSGFSAELAKRQLVGLSELFQGVGSNGADNLGLHDYLLCLRPLTDEEDNQGVLALADDIKERFMSIKEALDEIPDPMSATLISNKPLVDEAHDLMQMTVPSIKHEMTSAMGVQISYQDNDGD